MTRYIISDLHIGHENIIEYTSRPFNSVEKMDAALIENWNTTVDDNDVVFFLGDLTHKSSTETPASLLRRLNGNILFVNGNHDKVTNDCSVPVVEDCVISHNGYRFFCTHQPMRDHDAGWVLHGHVHNNDLIVYPFVNHGQKTVNVSAELLDFEPLPMDTLTNILSNNENYRYLADYV